MNSLHNFIHTILSRHVHKNKTQAQQTNKWSRRMKTTKTVKGYITQNLYETKNEKNYLQTNIFGAFTHKGLIRSQNKWHEPKRSGTRQLK